MATITLASGSTTCRGLRQEFGYGRPRVPLSLAFARRRFGRWPPPAPGASWSPQPWWKVGQREMRRQILREGKEGFG